MKYGQKHLENKGKRQLWPIIFFPLFLTMLFFQCSENTEPMSPIDLMKNYIYPSENKDARLDFFGKTVLAFFKSSDGQTSLDNEIQNYLAPVLKNLGLSIKFWNIEDGVPALYDLGGIRAVLSWFRSGAMQDPQAYLSFLDQTIQSGRKVIIIDNMGAYEYKKQDSEQYVDQALINLTLGKLGLWYRGEWTDDPKVISIVDKVSDIVEKGGEQDTAKSAFYYSFIPVDKDLKIYLSLGRKDMNIEPSPVIVSNKNGGFILSRYIYQIKDNKPNMLIDFYKFFEQALFSETGEEYVALLTDLNDPQLNKIAMFTYYDLRRVGLKTALIPKKQFANLTPDDLFQFTALGLLLKDDEGLSKELLLPYLNQGGALASFIGGSFPALAALLKAKPVARSKPESRIGYLIEAGFAMGEAPELSDEQMKWFLGNIDPENEVNVLGADITQTIPMVWTAAVENGRVIVWNWDGFLGGNLLGLIVESFLYLRPVGAALTLGFGHVFMDDWPLPMYNSVKEPISTTDTEFYTEVFWPDIKNIFASRNIIYSTYVIFNYNDIVSPPFTGGEFFIADGMSSLQTAQEILNRGTEMGFHGYNHMSLTREKTTVNINKWPSVDNMIASLAQGRKTWINLFGSDTLPFAYVAVNNIISEEGVAALHKVFPTIKIISALHWGVDEETYTSIGPHPYIPGLYYLPRITYGYQNTAVIRNLLISGMNGPGIISHFIHPDDVYDPKRSDEKDWSRLKTEFQEFLDFAREQYPWINWLSLHDAYSRLAFYDTVNFSMHWENDMLTVSGSPGMLFRVRTNDYRLQALQGAKIVYSYKKMPYLILEATEKTARLKFIPK